MDKRSPGRPAPPNTPHYFSSQPGGPQPTDLRWIAARAAGLELHLATGAGVFARSGLDAGSHLLIQSAAWPEGARVCDLGCGWGALGCFAARKAPQSPVWMCDINARAAALAHLNARHNDLPNAHVWCGDGLSAVRQATFDVVLCNPPVRAGNAVIARLFEDAAACLKPGGALWVVLRTAQGAKSWQKRLAAQFGDCQIMAMQHGYRILKSVKDGTASSNSA